MIITEFYDGQGLGNQLWVYVACRSIASKLKYPFQILGRERFKGADFLELDFGSLDGPYKHPELSLHIFKERIYYDKDLNYFSSNFDVRVLHLPPYTKIEGLFQSEQYFFEELSIPEKYIKIKDGLGDNLLIPDDVCVINLRGGEYKRHKQLLLPEYYWKMAMSNIRTTAGIKKFVVVTDDLRYAKSLFPNFHIISGNIAECYIALYQAKYVILSNSSFAYFPVKSSKNKSMVIAPFCWARFGNKFNRWCSPANLYKGWLWQDTRGKLFDYDLCLEIKNKTLEYYQQNFDCLVPKSELVKRSIRDLIPRRLRQSIKTALSYIFPRHFG